MTAARIRTKGSGFSRRVWGDPIGTTKEGCAIYRSILGSYAVEHDFLYLVAPTEAEMEEIRQIDTRETGRQS